jgi:hypothetical protein
MGSLGAIIGMPPGNRARTGLRLASEACLDDLRREAMNALPMTSSNSMGVKLREKQTSWQNRDSFIRADVYEVRGN